MVALEGQLKFLADFSGVFALAQQIAPRSEFGGT